jgi:hypothetical protein
MIEYLRLSMTVRRGMLTKNTALRALSFSTAGGGQGEFL